MQHPILTAVDGGIAVDFDTQERQAWGVLADACADALTILHLQHPERQAFLTMHRECLQAAGRQFERVQLQTA